MACDLCLDRMNEKPMYRYAGVSVYLDSAARALRVVEIGRASCRERV